MEKMGNVNAETAGGDAVVGTPAGGAAVETVSAVTVNAGDATVNVGSGNGNENGFPAPAHHPYRQQCWRQRGRGDD